MMPREMAGITVGIDLVSIDEVEQSMQRFGQRYLDRVFTKGELLYALASDGQQAARLAARFAAKEAVIKVLRPNDEPVPWLDVEIRRTPGGGCDVKLCGRAAALARSAGIDDISVSLTHHGATAAAVAAATRSPSPTLSPGSPGSEHPK